MDDIQYKLDKAKETANDIDEISRHLFRIMDGFWIFQQLRDQVGEQVPPEVMEDGLTMIEIGIHLLAESLLVLKFYSYQNAVNLGSNFDTRSNAASSPTKDLSEDEMKEEWCTMVDKVDEIVKHMGNTFGTNVHDMVQRLQENRDIESMFTTEDL